MKKQIVLYLLLLYFYLLSGVVYSQKYTISGYIEDSETSERLTGASVFSTNNSSNGLASNEYGYFNLTLPVGKTSITCSYVGYSKNTIELYLTKDTFIILKLIPLNEIDEVLVSGKKNTVGENQIGIIEAPLGTIKRLPVILGETDIMKSIQMLPGIKGGTEGTSGIYIRGGSPDQNLILIDGVPVYNINHLFGFFSVFNSDAISGFDIIKGGFPARYGGHLSSVLEVRMKEGNMQKRHTSFNIGLLSSSFVTEGPIIKDKASYIVSVRRSYLDLLVRPALWIYSSSKKQPSKTTFGYYFGDLNAKINYKFSEKDRIYLSIYQGKDKLIIKETEKRKNGYELRNSVDWGNLVSAFRWNHIFTPELFCNTSVTYSQFHYNISSSDKSRTQSNIGEYVTESKASYLTNITDWATNITFNYMPIPYYNAKFGGSGIYHIFNPGISVSKSSFNQHFGKDTVYEATKIKAPELALFLENEIKLSKAISINIGGRLNAFYVRDTLIISPEPRISFIALITDNFSIKGSYSKTKQFINLLTSTTIGFPTDLWVPSTNKVLPQNATQYAISANYNLHKRYEFIIEGYYKEMNNLIEYKEGASLFLDFENSDVKDASLWEDKITQGAGWAYGLEFLLRKDFGKLNGWISYTLAWSNRKFKEIDNNNMFPFTYDRRHEIAIACTYKLNKKIDFGLNWVFYTGNAVTLETSSYLNLVDIQRYNPNPNNQSYINYTNYYEHRNNFRMPVYHRLDLSVSLLKEKKRGSRILNIGLYNAYNRINPFYVLIDNVYTENKLTGKKLNSYGLFPIIPSISYQFKFN